ncbi:MAG: hypothetical protein ABIN58_12560, partial [candidate division WOR-3 bacterium]
AEAGFWPLYEGKHIEQFLVDIKPIERWVSLEACERKYGKPPDPGPKLVFRDIARNTDERTCIAAVLPERSCANHKLPIMRYADGIEPALLSVMNSLAFDFTVRLRSGSTSLTFSHLARCPVPDPSAVMGPDLNGLSGIEHVSTVRDHWPDLWLFNRAVAEAYDLTPDDFAHILSTFPVFARKRPAFFAYLQKRLAEWAEEVRQADKPTVHYEAEHEKNVVLQVAEGGMEPINANPERRD